MQNKSLVRAVYQEIHPLSLQHVPVRDTLHYTVELSAWTEDPTFVTPSF